MLWPEEYAKFEPLVKDDLIGFVRDARTRPPPRPGRAGHFQGSSFRSIVDSAEELSKGVGGHRLHKGVDRDREAAPRNALLRLEVRVCPGNLDVYLEILGLAGVRRAIYRVGSSLKIRYDDRLISDLESAIGDGKVRLVGPHGATARVEAVTPRPSSRTRSDRPPAGRRRRIVAPGAFTNPSSTFRKQFTMLARFHSYSHSCMRFAPSFR